MACSRTVVLLVAATLGVNCAPVHQVLPPMPGYIPVYIQHGDSVPEDTVELAKLFRVAGSNERPTDQVNLSVLSVSDTTPSVSPSPPTPTTSSSTQKSPENEIVNVPNNLAMPDKNIDFSNEKFGNLPDDLEISPDIIPAMIDASKQDAEESKNSESQKEPEKNVTETNVPETTTAPGTTSSA